MLLEKEARAKPSNVSDTTHETDNVDQPGRKAEDS